MKQDTVNDILLTSYPVPTDPNKPAMGFSDGNFELH